MAQTEGAVAESGYLLAQDQLRHIPNESVSQQSGRVEDFLLAFHTLEAASHIDLDVYHPYHKWLLLYISNKFLQLPPSLRQLGRNAANDDVAAISLSTFQDILITVATALGAVRRLSIEAITDVLREQNLVTGDDRHREQLYHLTFICVGMITMLYNPQVVPIDGHFGLQRTGSSILNQYDTSQTWFRSEIPIELCTQPINDLLKKMGGPQGPIPRLTTTGPTELIVLKACNVSFYHLHRLGNITVVWVDSLCQHLEFNKRERTLGLFRSPSFCALLALGGQRGIFLDCMFNDYFEDLDLEGDFMTAISFFKELLTTYRLIFGQDRDSWELAASVLGGNQNNSIFDKIRDRLRRSNDTTPSNAIEDPLLRKLCCRNSDDEELYDRIQAGNARSIYAINQDFPFFGERNVALQEYSHLLYAYDLKTLWYDRRDLNKFYAIWAVIVFSIITLCLALLGLALAAAQVAGSFSGSSSLDN